MFFQTKHKRYTHYKVELAEEKKLLPIGFEPMISTLLVWRLTNLAIEASILYSPDLF